MEGKGKRIRRGGEGNKVDDGLLGFSVDEREREREKEKILDKLRTGQGDSRKWTKFCFFLSKLAFVYPRTSELASIVLDCDRRKDR